MLYSAFGLSLAADWPIPGLIPQAFLSRPDIRVWLHQTTAFSDIDNAVEELHYISDDAEAGVPALQVWKTADGAYFRVRYADDTQFLVAGTGREVRAISPEASTLEDTATYLLGPVLGFVLRLRGVTCLHASVVAVGDCAIAIAGPAGAGKSTAAAAFAAMGHRVLADDIAALVEHDGVIHVQPAYPQLRLWPESVAMLYGSPDALPRLTPTWDKRALDLSRNRCFQERPLPLAAVYVFDGVSADTEPSIGPVDGRERLLMLLPNIYVRYLLESAMRRQDFELLARLAATVHVRRIVRPAGSADVTTLCARLFEDCETLGCMTSPTMER